MPESLGAIPSPRQCHVTDFAAVCFEAFQKADPDETVTLLVYEASYFDTLQVDASNSVSAFNFNFPYAKQRICGVIKRIITLHPQRHRLEFTGWHYALVTKHSLARSCYANSR